MANKTPTKTSFNKDNQPSVRKGRGKSERTKILESFERLSRTEDEFYDLLTKKAFNPEDHFSFKELLNQNIVINLNEKNKILSIDITDRNISFPKEGIFVALEWVGNTENLGFGYSKLTNKDNSHYAVLTSLEFKKNIWIPLTPKKEDKTIAHFGITTKQSE